jgi:hypothetical protein
LRGLAQNGLAAGTKYRDEKADENVLPLTQSVRREGR